MSYEETDSQKATKKPQVKGATKKVSLEVSVISG